MCWHFVHLNWIQGRDQPHGLVFAGAESRTLAQLSPPAGAFHLFTETWCFTTLSCSNSNLPSLSFLHFLHSLFLFLPLHLLRILTVLFLIHKLDKNIIKPANSYTKTSHQLCVHQMTEVYTGTWFRDWCWTTFKKSHSWQRWHWPVKFCSIILLSS